MSDGQQSTSSQSPSVHPDKDSRGRFIVGHTLNPHGNPWARQMAVLRSAAIAAATPERVHGLMVTLFAKAESGDVAAARLVLAYAVGRPLDIVDSGEGASALIRLLAWIRSGQHAQEDDAHEGAAPAT